MITEKDTPVIDTDTVKTDDVVGLPETGTITEPKKRGRPKGSKNGKIKMDGKPAEAVNEVKKDAPKRGRPSKKASVDKETLANQLIGLHQLGAMVSGVPELALQSQEAAMLADAVISVSKEYDLAIDGKTGALIQLAAACAAIYAPRIMLIQSRKKQPRLAAVPKRNIENDNHKVDANAPAPH
ncbi:MAG: hypothetical protein ACREHG_05425 [Candidatus Saccharimonadales bacterium]